MSASASASASPKRVKCDESKLKWVEGAKPLAFTVSGSVRSYHADTLSKCVVTPDGAWKSGIKMVGVYAQKGGVGKTTLAVSLAGAAIAQGKRVLLVDADGQCNLTEWLAPGCIGTPAYKQWNIHEMLTASLAGQRCRFRAQKCVEVLDGKALLLPGHMLLSALEPQLVMSLMCGVMMRSNIELAASLPCGIMATAVWHAVDLVIVDMSPHAGMANALLCAGCTDLVFPLGPNRFSTQFLEVAPKLFGEWERLTDAYRRDLIRGDPIDGFTNTVQLSKHGFKPKVYVAARFGDRDDGLLAEIDSLFATRGERPKRVVMPEIPRAVLDDAMRSGRSPGDASSECAAAAASVLAAVFGA